MIDTFKGEYYFLSNMYPCTLYYKNKRYLSSESAYQASKTTIEKEKELFKDIDGYEAKKLGKTITLRSDWNRVKYTIMKGIIRCKFEQNPVLLKKLLATGNEKLLERNYWGDTYWGVCNGIGDNKLGKILMEVREDLAYDNTQIFKDFISNIQICTNVSLSLPGWGQDYPAKPISEGIQSLINANRREK